MMKKILCGLGIAGLVVLAGPASADFIDFESDALGAKPNGFASVDSGQVTFTDSSGADLFIYSGFESDGRSLAVGADDSSYLIMNFSALFNTISLDFGNDDPFFSDPGDMAVLRLYLGATLVGTSTVVMNRDDLMNQSIAYTGADFDRAEFFYDVTVPTPVGGTGLIELVDNIFFDHRPIPEPATMTLLGLGLAGLAARARRNKSQA